MSDKTSCQPESSSVGTLDRRRDPRLHVDEYVCVARTDGSGREHFGLCTDVSSGGLGLEVDTEFTVGEVVEIRVEPPRAGTPGFRGRIMYRESCCNYGVSVIESISGIASQEQ